MKELKLTNHDNRPPSGHETFTSNPPTIDGAANIDQSSRHAVFKIVG
jgi:hypothetical protein